MAQTPLHLFDQLLTTQRFVPARGAAGGIALTWTNNLIGVPARIQPMSGDEVVKYGRTATTHMWRLFVDPANDISTKDRIVYAGHTMNIVEITNLQMNGTVTRIIAEEVVSVG